MGERDMALTYTVEPGVRLVTITGEYGDATQWQQLAQRMLADTRLQSGFSFIRDLRGGQHRATDATILETFDVVRRFWPLFKPSKAAIVTRREDATVAMVVQALADGQDLPIRTFDSYEAALDWIGAASPQRSNA